MQKEEEVVLTIEQLREFTENMPEGIMLEVSWEEIDGERQ